MKRRIILFVSLLALAAAERAQPPGVRGIDRQRHATTELRNERPSGGLLKDFGDALTRRVRNLIRAGAARHRPAG